MKKKTILYLLLISAAIGIRLGCFDYRTLDYENFLSKWVDFYRYAGGFRALNYSVGNYNIPYLYFLAFFSYFRVDDLYLIKALSCLFDFLLAWACAGLAEKGGVSKRGRDICFFAILFLPTVIMNGALWAQCDSIYVSLALVGLYLALDDRPGLSMVFIALSFGFKLQAVFLMPCWVILWIYKKYDWKFFFLFPLTYFALILPAVLAGRPIRDAVLLYLDQMGTVGSAPNYNSPALNALTRGPGSIAAAVAAMAALILLAIFFRRKLDNRSVILLCALMALVIPFFLPHMHDRYFYSTDVLSVVIACLFLIPGLAAPVLAQFASLICYIAYLRTHYIRIGHIFLTNDRGTVALLFVLAIYLYAFFKTLLTNKENLV